MKDLNGIKGVTLDVGGTLIEPWPSVGHVYAEVAARHGCKDLSAPLLNRRFKEAWKSSERFDYTREGWKNLVALTFGELISPSDLNRFFPELYERFAMPDVWRLFDDVLPTVEALASSGIRLGIISNWDERLSALLRNLQLERYFYSIIVSCEVGCTKPYPEIFQQAARRLNLQAESILHVGDSYEMDVEGAVAAGFQALHLQRGCGCTDGQGIGSLAEILGRLLLNKQP